MEDPMTRRKQLSAVALVAMIAITGPALAQSRPSNGLPATLGSSERPTAKSDAYRVVGKVLDIDQAAGVVKLQTEEGVVMAKPRPELVRAARVGDTISVPRPENDAPSASPRTK
jgi:hypothetical protein